MTIIVLSQQMPKGIANGYKDLQRSNALNAQASRLNTAARDLLSAHADLTPRILESIGDMESLAEEYGPLDSRVVGKRIEIDGMLARRRFVMAQAVKLGSAADRLIRKSAEKQARARVALDRAPGVCRTPLTAPTCIRSAGRGRERHTAKARTAPGGVTERPRSSDDDPAPLGARHSGVVIRRVLARAAAIVSSLGMVSR